jgi:hypothetical protein
MVRARKIHKCGECSREILPGEQYEYATGGCSDSIIDQHKTCADCLSVRDSFFCNGWMYGVMWEQLWEHIFDMGGEIDSSCIVPLTPKAQGDVCDLIEQVWADDLEEE